MLFLFLFLSCKDLQNQNTDYFAMFKTPKISGGTPRRSEGIAFFYTDSSKPTLFEADSDVDSNTNPLYYTLNPLYEKNASFGWAIFNDQSPNYTSSSSGHMKGVLMFDESTALYLEQSTPKFPDDPRLVHEYGFVNSGKVNGQSFLCLNLDSDGLINVTDSFLIQRPYFYSWNLPPYSSLRCPSLSKAIEKKWNNNNLTQVSSIKVGQNSFHLFAKGPKWGQELYHDLLAPFFRNNVFAQSWSNGVGTLDSDCSGSFSAFNVLNINFLGLKWARSKDHSKWAVTENGFLFIGGTNRQNGQLKRGGGGFALFNQNLASQLRKVVDSFEECSFANLTHNVQTIEAVSDNMCDDCEFSSPNKSNQHSDFSSPIKTNQLSDSVSSDSESKPPKKGFSSIALTFIIFFVVIVVIILAILVWLKFVRKNNEILSFSGEISTYG